MLVLLSLAVLGVGVALFAMQNSQPVALHFGGYSFVDVPIYVLVLCTLLIGFFISWIISLFNSIFTSLTLRGKNNKIKKAEKDKTELTKQLHKLELENEHLKDKDTVDDKSM